MSHMAKVIEKLPAECKSHLENRKSIMRREDCSKELRDAYKHETVGYLTALANVGIITQSDWRALHLFYVAN